MYWNKLSSFDRVREQEHSKTAASAISCFDLSINKTELLNLRNILDKNLTELIDGLKLQTSRHGSKAR